MTTLPAEKLRCFYPPIAPHAHDLLDVGEGHHIYWEECGNPAGKPVIFLHGGPGAGCNENHRRLFDPRRYRVVLFDQRGCGRSIPHAHLEANTTWHLVDDIERLRILLNIERWQVFGGSWGSTLALAYAQAHPQRVTELIVRGIFTSRQKELDWFYQHGASMIFPEVWQGFIAPVAEAERGDLMSAYHRLLHADDQVIRLEAAQAWSTWEGHAISLLPNPDFVAEFSEAHHALAIARIENHYFVNKSFFAPDQLLLNAGKLHNIPGIIVQGRYDVICPPQTAWELHQAWPQSELIIVPDAGHSVTEPGILDQLIRATDRFADC
ncbi:prolyl aminopeptidase [Glaciimonas immobilis]|uniref:Proline iminopeptidase n=1 Tax=Glaciimonas immobilis TaxID=728004 RepID=A0A840RXF6_9BURK|nr:prolyl aminopeptidase [Glaciimonas immobilis]KAF3997219.1 prolyl aminopeptidase [Glaciimonas immobilis]MBB5202263.1 proline iminopeptidase [Glaciimonas immobilis]